MLSFLSQQGLGPVLCLLTSIATLPSIAHPLYNNSDAPSISYSQTIEWTRYNLQLSLHIPTYQVTFYSANHCTALCGDSGDRHFLLL